MRYFFSSDDIEADTEDVPAMGAFRALGLDPDREPEALKVTEATYREAGLKHTVAKAW